MGVTVDNQVGADPVHRLGQQVAPKERIDLEPLTLQGPLDRRIVQQDDPAFCLDLGQRLLQPGRQ